MAVALASEATRNDAAAVAGLARNRVPPEIDESREELVATTTARLAGIATAAVDPLVELCR